MPHPLRADPDDPLLERVRQFSLAYPEASERVSFGRPNFIVRTAFAFYGGSRKGVRDDSDTARSLVTKPDADDRLAWLEDERFYVPAYVGPSGWVGFRLDVGEPDWQLVAELIEASYRNTAPARLVRLLDEAPGGARHTGAHDDRSR